MPNFEPNPHLKTLPGWKTIDLVDASDISAFTVLNGMAAYSLKSDAAAPHNFDTSDIKQSCTSENGIFNHNITFRLAARSRAYEHALWTLSYKRFLAILTDNNGDRFVAGCPQEPLHLNYDSEDNGDADGSAAYTLKLFCNSRLPLLKLNS